LRSVVVAVVVSSLSAMLGAPRADAEVFTFVISDRGELPLDFGLLSVHLSAQIESGPGDGSFDLVSGSLTDFDSDPGFTSYTYAPGLLTMQLHMFNPGDGPDVDGVFTAPVLGFSIDVTELRECEEDEEADDCEDPDFPGSTSDVLIPLGPGTFDRNIARVLGIREKAFFTDLRFIGLEGIDGGPDSQERRGFEHGGNTVLTIDTFDVPEPGLLALGLAAAAMRATRRQRR
jgi:hypothetical protein